MPNIPIDIGYGMNTLTVCGLIVTNYNWIMRPFLDGELLKVYVSNITVVIPKKVQAMWNGRSTIHLKILEMFGIKHHLTHLN